MGGLGGDGVEGAAYLSLVMVMTGEARMLAVMEWSGRRLLGGGVAVLLSLTLIDISWEEMRILRLELLKLRVGALLPLPT